MSETRKNHLTIDGGQVKDCEHVASYKPIPESDTESRSSRTSVHKSKEKLSSDGAEEKLLQKEEEAKIVTRVDMVDAKYAVGDHRNGDAKIELDANKKQFSGLTKEELMKYAEDPFWVRLRWIMFALFWALWLCMLVGAIAIIVRAPSCNPPQPRPWYEKGPLVDMKFDEENYTQADFYLTELQDAKVSGMFAFVCEDAYVVLNESPPTCLTKFKALAKTAKIYGVRLIVDLVANFVSKTHTWYQQSENKTGNFSDYFIWASSEEFDSNGQRKKPNNWVSTENVSAWTWSDKRQQFYLHQFKEDQPDLNFRNPQVISEFDAVIKVWMQAGAAGIRLLHARELLVSPGLEDDEHRSGKGSVAGAGHTQYAYYTHRHTRDQPELEGLLAHWAARVATDATDDTRADGTIFTIYEENIPELFVLDLNTTYLRPPSSAELALQNLTQAAAFITQRVESRWPTIQLTFENSTDEELAAFAMLLPASPILRLDQIYLNNHIEIGGELLIHAAGLREEPSIQHGEHEIKAVPVHNSTDTVIACARWKVGSTGYVSVYNAGDLEARADLTSLSSIPEEVTVYRVSPANQNYTTNMRVDSNGVLVQPKSVVLFSYVPKKETEQ